MNFDPGTHSNRAANRESKITVPTRNQALTGIRGFAALWVLVYHLSFRMDLPHPIIARGYLGVDLFFLLSGMILAMTYGHKLAQPSLRALRDFAIGRAFRILPLYWLTLAAMALLVPLMNGKWLADQPHTFNYAVLCASLIQTWIGKGRSWNAPAWSLSTEMMAYIFFPVMAILVFRIEKRWHALCLAAASILLLFAILTLTEKPDLDQTGRLSLARCLSEFFAGMLVYRALILRPLSAAQGNACLLLGIAFFALAMPPSFSDFPTLAGFALMLAACTSPAAWPQRLFGNRLAFFLGEISFSIYILHWFFIEFHYGALNAGLLVGKMQATIALLAIPVVLIPLSWATWRWIEKPCQRAGKSLARWFDQRYSTVP